MEQKKIIRGFRTIAHQELRERLDAARRYRRTVREAEAANLITSVNAGEKVHRLAGEKCISDAGMKAPELGPFRQASGLDGVIRRQCDCSSVNTRVRCRLPSPRMRATAILVLS